MSWPERSSLKSNDCGPFANCIFLCNSPRTVYLTFDVDANQSGQRAAELLAHRLDAKGIAARRVLLPQGHDPNSFFVEGGDAPQFQSLLEAALP